MKDWERAVGEKTGGDEKRKLWAEGRATGTLGGRERGGGVAGVNIIRGEVTGLGGRGLTTGEG